MFFLKGKEDKILTEDPRLKQIMLETLHVRLSLVGSMFDFILVIIHFFMLQKENFEINLKLKKIEKLRRFHQLGMAIRTIDLHRCC